MVATVSYVHCVIFAAESDVPAGAIKVGSRDAVDGGSKVTDTYYVMPGRERTVETRTTVKEASKYDGIGPVDESTGMPVGFRSVRQHDGIGPVDESTGMPVGFRSVRQQTADVTTN